MAHTVDIIDEDEMVRNSTRALFEVCGFQVREHLSAEEFLRHLGPEAVCLVVNLNVPVEKGLSLLERLHGQGRRTPAVLIADQINPVIKSRLAHIGAKLLRRPAGGDELLDAVKQVTHLPR